MECSRDDPLSFLLIMVIIEVPQDHQCMGVVILGAFTSSATATQNNERRGSDGYSSVFGSSKTNPVGSSFYGTSAAAGALAASSFNPTQIDYDGRGLQSYTPAPGGMDKSSLGSSMYDIDAFINSAGSIEQGKYERRGPEINNSAFGGDNLSNIGTLGVRI
ncbi:hypothetical protein KI387_025102 [Taxus chinensis]|uniref:Uncharacterized protein n=1 Tax=Taxus chinensis TaxID=29808 RepID=A0AA38LCA3_TAXCH|nr:hypothetical protein KI387_025102 [Taxus chinensis]